MSESSANLRLYTLYVLAAVFTAVLIAGAAMALQRDTREQAVRLGTMLGICYDLAKELMPRHAYNFD